MNAPTPSQVEHARYCLPRPGESEPRMESYDVARTAADGVTPIGYARITRCIECGEQRIDG